MMLPNKDNVGAVVTIVNAAGAELGTIVNAAGAVLGTIVNAAGAGREPSLML